MKLKNKKRSISIDKYNEKASKIIKQNKNLPVHETLIKLVSVLGQYRIKNDRKI